ncbi:MAG TPA: DEAD/DEAH box helicase [Pseudomonadales bacterium]
MSASAENITFKSLQLSTEVIQALDALGYEKPTPIQAETIPLVLEGRDVLGQAQTGTGKTAAFALPILSNIDLSRAEPQALVLAPTRELALQVAEAFQSYARHLKGFNVLPIYGGQGYDTQLRQLRRGVHVVVGTPGRVMDHITRGTLKLDSLKTLVLDEADEMLRMGFIDAVEWVLQHTPPTRQIALFSATMPKEIRRVAESHLKDPVIVKIASKTTTATTIRQRYWQVGGVNKLDALTRILEVETFDAMLIFVRTKVSTNELAEKLTARGYAAEALNGDIAQIQRERIVDRFKGGKLDIVVATDVAARGLDVERISHVVNYDIPYDTESYVHRIGRTGRAGRSGEAILFVAARERRMLAAIERATSQRIEQMNLPSSDEVNQYRIQRFGQSIKDALQNTDLKFYEDLLTTFQQENDVPPMVLAAALASMLQGDQPLLMEESRKERDWKPENRNHGNEGRSHEGRSNEGRLHEVTRGHRSKSGPDTQASPLREFPEVAMQRFRIDVGHEQGVKPGNIVGAIANEGDIDSRYIGHIEIFDQFSVIDLPDGMPKDVLNTLKKTRICGRPSGLTPMGSDDAAGEASAGASQRKPRRSAEGGHRRSEGDNKRSGPSSDRPRRTRPVEGDASGDKRSGPPADRPRRAKPAEGEGAGDKSRFQSARPGQDRASASAKSASGKPTVRRKSTAATSGDAKPFKKPRKPKPKFNE